MDFSNNFIEKLFLLPHRDKEKIIQIEYIHHDQICSAGYIHNTYTIRERDANIGTVRKSRGSFGRKSEIDLLNSQKLPNSQDAHG